MKNKNLKRSWLLLYKGYDKPSNLSCLLNIANEGTNVSHYIQALLNEAM